MQNIGNVVYFNSAYYWAIAWVERAQLVLKYKQPGFEWSWGFLKWDVFGPTSDQITWDFWFLSYPKNWFAWTIHSRTDKIPNIGQWNVDYLFTSWNDSKNYNKLWYYMSEKIIFNIDNTLDPNLYYTWTSIIKYFSGGSFSWIIRLPPAAISRFNWELLCDTCDYDDDGIKDDIVVNRILDWIQNWKSFSIIPNISIFYYSWWIVDSQRDIAIREKIINETWALYFWDTMKNFSPLADIHNILTEHNVLSETPDSIKSIWFNSILNSSEITGLKLWIGIVDILRTENNNIYPFLEYQFSFPQKVADSFYTLQWIWLAEDYNVKIFIKKSTNEQSSSIGDFTIIF